LIQGEVAILLTAACCQADRVFFVGDTAQSITHGVDFRFEEVRGAHIYVMG
jgi:hypothetical protein